MPKGTVMSRLFHARKNLQRTLRPILGVAEGMGPSGRPLEDGSSADATTRAAADLTERRKNEEPAPSRRLASKAPGGAATGD